MNPALKNLEVFIGQWTAEISNASFLPDLSQTLQSTASFDWLEDGASLILRQGIKKTSHAAWIIGRDQDLPNYTVLYFDDRQFSRVYEMSFENNIWKMWRNAPNFVQSFEGTMNEDRKTIIGAWSKSLDGEKWEHDFDLTYRRAE